jgi:hypothetical protein
MSLKSVSGSCEDCEVSQFVIMIGVGVRSERRSRHFIAGGTPWGLVGAPSPVYMLGKGNRAVFRGGRT